MKLRHWSIIRLSALALNTNTERYIEHRFTAMASPCLFLLPATMAGVQDIARTMENEVRRIEQKYSRYREDSILSQINQNAGTSTPVDAETHYLLNYARICFEQSEGRFDISSGVLRKAWNFRSPSLPAAEQLHALQQRIGLQRLLLSEDTVTLAENMELDFGGIGKEYAADAAANIAHQHGVDRGMVDLGGDLHIIGPQRDVHGEAIPWKLGVRNPRHPDRAIAQLPVYSGGMATSGDYERFFEINGQRYCHILNPQTGYPVNYWASVTVLAPSCLLAGTLSTIAMLKEQSAKQWLSDQAIYALLIDQKIDLTALSPKTATEG